MAIMRKDVNFVLFILIIVTLLAFVGFSTYYQKTFRNVSTEYEQKISELDEVSSSLQVAQTNLSKTSRELKVKAEREEDLSKKYTDVKDERDQFESSFLETREQLTETTEELENTKSELDTANAEISDLNSEVSSLKDTIASKNTAIDALQQCASDNGITC